MRTRRYLPFYAGIVVGVALALLIGPADAAAGGARGKKARLRCVSPSGSCLSCSLSGGDTTTLLGLPNTWRVTVRRTKLIQQNQVELSVCGLEARRASVKLSIATGRRTKRFSASVRVSGSTPPPPPPPPPAQVLGVENLRYLGTALLPKTAVGRSTGFEVGLLGVRVVDGERRFFNDTHIYSSGLLYEATVPGFAVAAPFPEAHVVREWGSIYGNKRVDANLQPYGSGPPVNGLLWDPVRGGLWWAYGEQYNTLNRNAPSVGFTQFNADGSITPTDALGLHESGMANHWTRGCVIQVPTRYADLFGGRRLAAGCGGYYSIIGGGSWGPALTLFDPDLPGDRVTVLGYPEWLNKRAPRPGDYFIADTAGSGSGWMGPNPQGDVGAWTGADEIGGEGSAGAAVFLDRPAGRGVLIWASLGQGRIGYDAGAITAASRRNRLYVYDPEKLVEVYHGSRDRSFSPDLIADWPIPAGFLEGRIAGVAQDPLDPDLIYIVQTYAYKDGVEYYPVLHQYRLVARN